MAADPLQQFMVRPLIALHAFGQDLSFTNAAFFMLLAAIIPVIFFSLWRSIPNALFPDGFSVLER